MTNASNTTQYYQLSLWEDDDLVRRQDFNSDHNAIDAALHSLDADITALEAADTALTAAYQAADAVHTTRTDNPHSVTAAQVGAAAAEHSHTASALTYSNTTSGLAAENVQAAIDEVKSSVGNFREIVFGTYTGSGSTGQTIDLGFQPTAVFVFMVRPIDGAATQYSNYKGIFSGLALQNQPIYDDDSLLDTNRALYITSSGFYVKGRGGTTEYNYVAHLNLINAVYTYCAVK